MGESDEKKYSLIHINAGDWAKPANILIEKISDAIGGIVRPWQIRRVAEAEAEADRIHVAAEIEITKLQRRAAARFIAEESKRQNNIESITALALTQLNPDANPKRRRLDREFF